MARPVAPRAEPRVSEAVLQDRYRQALGLHRQGELDAAEAIYRLILSAMPESFHALHMLGVLRGQRDDWPESERLLALAVRLDPSVAAAQANLGNAQRLLERRDDALASYDLALRLQPENARALKGRGLILWQRRQDADALGCYELLLRVEPSYGDGWIIKAALLDRLGRTGDAVACYREALASGQLAHPDRIRYLLAAMGDSDALPAAAPLDYVRELYEKYAPGFEAHLVDGLHYRVPGRLMELLRPLLGEGGLEVLDLGCGTGLCAPLLRPWARTLVGVDASERMLEEARRKEAYDELVEAELTSWLPGRVQAFDLIVAADVFIYFGDLRPVLLAARAALRAGGLFAFSTEASEDGEIRLGESLRYAHSADYLRRLAAETGFGLESLGEETIREEAGRDVPGHLTVLRRSG
jgi:predicted TPR repeat methyltransferase